MNWEIDIDKAGRGSCIVHVKTLPAESSSNLPYCSNFVAEKDENV
jgi:hypothetical protein